MFYAYLDTRHFTFSALGSTEKEATDAIKKGWNAWAKCNPGSVHPLDDVAVVEMELGAPLMDREPMTGILERAKELDEVSVPEESEEDKRQATVAAAVEAAINAGALKIQDDLGQDCGGFAGMHFGEDEELEIADVFSQYYDAEKKWMESDLGGAQ